MDDENHVKRSPLFVILLIAFVDLVGYGLIIPLQAVYAKRLNASTLTFGLLIGSYALMQLIFNPLLGRWSDRIGRRPVLLLSVGGSVISHLLLGVADLAHSLPWLFVARILDGITGANIATAQAYIADVTLPKDRAKGMGFFGAAFGLGFVIGPALGAALVSIGTVVSGESIGSAWPAFGAAVISLAAFLLAAKLLPEPKNKENRTVHRARHKLNTTLLRNVLSHPRLRELYGIMFLVVFSFSLLETTFVYLCNDRLGVKEAGAGLIFAYIGTMMVIVQGGLLGRLVKRFGEPTLITVGPFLMMTGFVLLSLVPMVQSTDLAWVLLLVGCIPVSCGQSLTGPNVNALISRHASEASQGSTLGLAQGLGSLARAIAPVIAGALYDHMGAPWPYRVGAVLFLVIGCIAAYIQPRQMRAIEPKLLE